MRTAFKTIPLILLMMVLSVVLFACSDASPSSDSSNEEASDSSSTAATVVDDKKTLVAYFSATGNTAPLAEYAADALDADLFEITPAEPYTSEDLDYDDSSTRATVEQKDKSARPAISGSLPNMDVYDTVVLAYPIWWGEEPRIMDAFVEGVDLGNKTVVAFCTSGGSGIGASDKNLAALANPSATWLEGTRFDPGASAADVESWLQDTGLL